MGKKRRNARWRAQKAQRNTERMSIPCAPTEDGDDSLMSLPPLQSSTSDSPPTGDGRGDAYCSSLPALGGSQATPPRETGKPTRERGDLQLEGLSSTWGASQYTSPKGGTDGGRGCQLEESSGLSERTAPRGPQPLRGDGDYCQSSEDSLLPTPSYEENRDAGPTSTGTTQPQPCGQQCDEVSSSGDLGATGMTASSAALAGAEDHLSPSCASQPQNGSASDKCRNTGRFKIKPFRRMIRQVGNLLSAEEVRELALLTEQSPDLVREIKADLGKPFQLLMISLEEQRIVGENNVDALLELLEEIEAEEALELVRDYEMSLSDSTVDTFNLASPLPQEEPLPPRIRSQQGDSRQEAPPKPCEPPSTGTRHPVTMTKRTDQGRKNNNMEDMVSILESLCIRVSGDKELSVIDSMTLDIVHLCEGNLSQDNVVVAFLSRLMSYDYRSLRLFKELEGSKAPTEESHHDLIQSFSQLSLKQKLSCRDIMYAIIRYCDAFLRQDVLSKMSACQLAVPVIIPQLDQTDSLFLLWGLQNISKAWQDPTTSKIHEASVSNHPFPVVTAIKLGNPDCSKSNILNKVLGSVQGNDDHPYFVSREQESNTSVLSHGTLEAVWYLPSGGKRGRHAFNKAMCFLNLRGDAGSLGQQLEFICAYTTVIILFISKKEIRKVWSQVSELAEKAKLITVLCSSGKSAPTRRADDASEAVQKLGAGVIDSQGHSTVDICEHLCQAISANLQQPEGQPKSLTSMVAFCEEKGVDVDICVPECADAKAAAESIIQECRAHPKEYKRKALPLQLLWQKWSQLDKDRSWKGAQGNVERELAKLHRAKEDQRRRQRETGMSKEMLMLYEELRHPSPAYRQYFVFWLHHCLNEVSFSHLRPLAEDLKASRDCLRKSGAEITRLQRNLNNPAVQNAEKRSIQSKIDECKAKEADLQKSLTGKTKVFDSSSLGFEHFVREFGQIYECFHNVHQPRHTQKFDVNLLPRMAAEMLLSGYPLEIFDGDTCHVPIKWVRGVLAAVRAILGDATVYVISVIGIQSSGKSTLLNSMFGVRFAVSAGRCTRGVFLQLLPIAESLKRELGCDYVAVIDTEGLKAPEKAIAERKNEDNELATFALCLSDMTLINIGGQTVGEDLSNILQIAAHAFIRMKEVHLRSSCYLIQQFVADITATYRNDTSTQSILQKLDQAVLTAAVEEKKEDQYRQFSDCFNIVNIDSTKESIQYIPSLWRGSMSSPNHDYSETVLALKAALLREIQAAGRVQKVSEFEERIVSVWEAVKQEDFVFNFRNTNEIAQYSNFTQIFKREQLRLTQEMMKWELNAKQMVKSTSLENLQARQMTLFQELDEKLTAELEAVKTKVEEMIMAREFESVRQHSVFFYRELDMVEASTRESIREMIRREASIITDAEKRETQFLPQLKANLRRQVLPAAEQLKERLPADYSDTSSESIKAKNEEIIREFFEEEWKKQMDTIQLDHPLSTSAEIRGRIEKDITRCVMETLGNTNISKEMKEFMNTRNLFELCQYSPCVKSGADIPEAHKLIANCTTDISSVLYNIDRIVEGEVANHSFCFSEEFIGKVSGCFRSLVSAQCAGCRDKMMLLLCSSCYVLQRAHEAYRDVLLGKIMRSGKLMEKLNIVDVQTVGAIKKDVESTLKESTTPPVARGILNMLKHFEDKVLAVFMDRQGNNENFQNQIRGGLHQIISKRNAKKWYSPQMTCEFMRMVNDAIYRRRVFNEHVKQNLLSEACTIYIQEATHSEKEALAEALSWTAVQETLTTGPLDIVGQMKMFTETLRYVLPPETSAALLKLPAEMIRKYSQISTGQDIRHTLDESVISELPVLSYENSYGLLSVITETRRVFLGHIQESGAYNTNVFRSVISELHQELSRRRELGRTEHVVALAHICSWVLPICVDMHVTFERENSVQSLLEKDKESLHQDFKSLCDGRCLDHLAAKAFCNIIVEALKANVKNRICTALFDRLSKAGDEIFCSRPRFLQAVLIDICEEERFQNYARFLCNHTSFIREWALNFIAKECCGTENNNISIYDIVQHEVDEIIRETEESLEASLREVYETDGEVPFSVWVEIFSKYFKDHLDASLNEDRISEMRMYANISDYSIFMEECKVILSDSLHQELVDGAEVPNLGCRNSIKEWFQCLPKKLHLVLAQSVQGCGRQCPFCRTLCDDTVKEHKVHFSNLHYPNGVGGGKYRNSLVLTTGTCVANVASGGGYYPCGCAHDIYCSHDPTPYKDYRRDYPDWDIRPIAGYEATLYWKWVLSRFNAEFARYYNGKEAAIPWGTVTKEEALSSIRSMSS